MKWEVFVNASRVRRRIVLATAILLFSAVTNTVLGQVELIVKPRPSSSLEKQLDDTVGQKQWSDPALGSVMWSKPLFTQRALQKTGASIGAVFVLAVEDSVALDRALAEFAAHPDVVYVQSNGSYTTDGGSDDPLSDSLGHFSVIDLPNAWSLSRGEATVTVGFVDTGVFLDHPDLLGQLYVNTDEDVDGDGRLSEADLNGIDEDGNGYVDDVTGYDFVDRPSTVEIGDFHDPDPVAADDGSGHGTTVAGVLSARADNGIGIAGVAPGARIVPLRAFGRDGRGEDDDVARAVVYAAELGLDVLNLSFGDVHVSPLLHDAIRFAVNAGTIVVASAGNVGGDSPHYPSDYPEVISVVWLDAAGEGISGRATHGVGVDIGAPGSSIYTTLQPVDEGDMSDTALYGRRSGSSLSAPMVSAAAALIRSVAPELSPASVRSALLASARDIEASGFDHRSGAGRLQAGRALQTALPSRVEIISPANDAGVNGDVVTVRGTVVDPDFLNYQLFYAEGDKNLSESSWTAVGPATSRQRWQGDLGLWNVGDLSEGLYTLRLAVTMKSGRTVEDRRRIYVDRTQPVIDVILLDHGLAGGLHAIVADIGTDDLSTIDMAVDFDGQTHRVESEKLTRRHGFHWVDASRKGGTALVTVRVRNVAGLVSEVTSPVVLPANRMNSGFVDVNTTGIPEGFLLEHLSDFDGDGLREVVLNVFEDGWIGDTVAVYEWSGERFRRAATLLAGAFPRDTGDSDSDGDLELLLQVGPTALVVEQAGNSYPEQLVYADTTGILPGSTTPFWGARLTDLDGDGQGEILGHDTRRWLVREWSGEIYSPWQPVENPTGVGASELSENTFEQPQPLVANIDNDSAPELIAGDSDGDIIAFRADGSANSLVPVWSYETDRYNAGSRLAAGDLNGNGRLELVFYGHNWLTTTSANTQEPDIGTYYILQSDGGGAYSVADSIPIPGEISRHGSAACADLDDDGRDELVIVNPPDLYVLQVNDLLQWELVFHSGPTAEAGGRGFRSTRVATGDANGDGRTDVFLGSTDGSTYMLTLPSMSSGVPVPAWVHAYASDSRTVSLSWAAQGADSVWIYRGPADGVLDLVASTSNSVFVDSVTTPSTYALRAWVGDEASELSRVVDVRPHAPALVVDLTHPGPNRIEIVFSEVLDERMRADQFVLSSGARPIRIVPTRNGRGRDLLFDELASGADTLSWSGILDVEGTPVGQTSVALFVPPPVASTLIIEEWTLAGNTADLYFSSPLNGPSARDVSNYMIRPSGRVASAQWSADRPNKVVLVLEGLAVGATGLNASLTVLRMVSQSGQQLAPEGTTVRLSTAAADLADVYVFPNPYRRSDHSDGLMIAGLPAGARVQIFSSTGELIGDLEEQSGTGGLRWSLTDERGVPVPSGIYLVRVTLDGTEASLKKAAVIN